jgi:ADP-heptose:LPS heptosyltransferase
MITIDTAMAHLANAFNKPCLAFFPTHDPLWRVRDYPLLSFGSARHAGCSRS